MNTGNEDAVSLHLYVPEIVKLVTLFLVLRLGCCSRIPESAPIHYKTRPVSKRFTACFQVV